MRFRMVGVLVATVALVLSLATPAAAETKTFKDPAGDVKTLRGGGQTASDLSALTVDFTPKRLRLSLSLHNNTVVLGGGQLMHEFVIYIDHNSDGYWDYRLNIHTSAGGAGDWTILGYHRASRHNDPALQNGWWENFTYTRKPGTAAISIDITDRYLLGRDGLAFNVQSTHTTFVKRYSPASRDMLPGPAHDDKKMTFVGPVKRGQVAAPTVTLGKKTIKQGKTTRVRIAVKPKVAGKATILDGKKTLRTVNIAKGKAKAVKLPKKLAVGKHKIRVKFVPAAKKFAGATSQAVTLTVKK